MAVAVAAGRAVAVVMVAVVMVAASVVVPADHGVAAVAAVLVGEAHQDHGKH